MSHYNTEKKNIYIFSIAWTLLVLLLFLHTSGKFDFALFHFPVAKGSLVVLQGYKNYNLIGLRDEVYALEQGQAFVHPKNTKKLKKNGIYVGHSIAEAIRMIEAKTDNIENKLESIEKNYRLYNIFKKKEGYFAIPAQDEESGNPLPNMPNYQEQFAGKSLEEAKRFIDKKNTVN
jgi:hypothetical protein